MSRSPSTSFASPTTAAGQRQAHPNRAFTRPGSGPALWCAIVAGVFALGAPGDALAQGETAAPAAAAPAASAGTSAAPAPEDNASVCLENHAQGQEFRLNGKLLEGREAFLRCSATQCPAQIQRDCLNYMEQIQLQIPSVGFRVSADGVNRADVKVFMDGKLVLEKLSGKALDLNPGSHELRIVLDSFAPHEETLVVSEGDKFRIVQVAFATPVVQDPGQGARQREMERPVPLSSYIFAGVSAAAIISGVGWGLSSWVLKKDLEDNCAPRCTKESVDVLRQRALITDVSWGVSAVSLGVAGVFYLLRPEVPVEGSVQVGLTVLDHHGAIGTVSLPAF